MKNLDILIKPASGLCNMRCNYCFYDKLLSRSAEVRKSIMSEDVLEALIRKAFEEAEESISFTFQGGEPTLAGLEFFKYFTDCVKARCNPGMRVYFSIQTNGLLLNEQWCDFFLDHNFLVGLSIDGIPDLHDMNRIDMPGKGTYTRIAATYAMLQEKGVDTNILCVVTGQTALSSQAVYQGLKKLGCRYMQFIPCLDPPEKPRGCNPYSLTPDRYARFLKTVFDLWYRDWQDGNYYSVRLFDDYVRLAAGLTPATCATSGRCGLYAVAEADGSIFPCDFYVQDQWKLGNILEQPMRELLNGALSGAFIRESNIRPEACTACKYQKLCRGGCKRDWQLTGADLENYYCRAFRDFFDYAYDRLMLMGKMERTAYEMETER